MLKVKDFFRILNMATLRLFASIKQAAGNRGQLDLEATTIEELLNLASKELGAEFSDQIQQCRIWLNGKPVEMTAKITTEDEVALLPPVSGGAGSA